MALVATFRCLADLVAGPSCRGAAFEPGGLQSLSSVANPVESSVASKSTTQNSLSRQETEIGFNECIG